MNAILLCLMLSLGTNSIERGEVAFRPEIWESSVPERFRLEPAVFAFELEPVMTTRTIRERWIPRPPYPGLMEH